MDENEAYSIERLFDLIYDDLRLRARKLLAQHPTNSLAATALVHEAYLKLAATASKQLDLPTGCCRLALSL